MVERIAPSRGKERRPSRSLRFEVAVLLGGFMVSTQAGPIRPGHIYHVRTNGSDSRCKGTVDAGAAASPNCAFATPQRAWDAGILRTRGGGTIMIHAGTYDVEGRSCPSEAREKATTILCADPNGSASVVKFPSTVLIQAAPGEEVTFDGRDEIATGLYVWNVSHVTVRGIRFRHFLGRRSSALATSGAAVLAGSASGAVVADDIVLDQIDVRDNVHCSGAETGDVHLAGSQGSHRVVLRNSYIEGRCPLGIVVNSNSNRQFSSGDLIEGNVLKQMVSIKSGYRGVRSRHVNDVTVRRNYFFAVDGFHSSEDQALGFRDCAGWKVSGNVFENFSGYLVYLFDEGKDGDQVERHVVENNTLIGNGKDRGICIHLQGATSSIVRNNIVDNCGEGIRLNGSGNGGGLEASTTIGYTLFGEGIAATHRYVDSSRGGYVVDEMHDQFGGENFTSGSARKPRPYFVPKLPSKAIDDGDGQHCAWKPADGKCDLGAYEAGEDDLAAK